MHHAAIADGSQYGGERQIVPDGVCAEIAFGKRDGIARTEEDVVKGAGIFAESGFVFRAAIEIVEHGARQTALGEAAEIFDIYYARRAEGGGDGSHGGYSMEKQPWEAIRKWERRRLSTGEETAPPWETDADPGRGIPLRGYKTKN
jgi:hypothetical protein